ncbi:hypothetical protein URS_2207 [Acinetobacter ursingii]|nr:hypothetical protein URS_2207 [Acinetobacter ursingii]
MPPVKLELFLNGVCRHEQYLWLGTINAYFLNGVCRHEPIKY